MSLNIGDEFASKQELKEKLQQCSAAEGFAFKVDQSTPKRFVIICPVAAPTSNDDAAASHCSFRVVAGRRKSGLFKISKLDLCHSPFCPQSRKRIAKTVVMATTSYTRNNVKTVTPGDVMALVRSTHAITPSYSTAWRALTTLTQSSLSMDAESFQFILTFLKK